MKEMKKVLGRWWSGVRNFFSDKKTPFGRVMGLVMALCLVIITVAVLDTCWLTNRRYGHVVDSLPISSKMAYIHKAYSDEPGWIARIATGEVITEDVEWVAGLNSGDSLVVFSSGGKRGYLNRYSGKVAIKPEYEKAWKFSSGVAGVAKDGRVFFINPKGERINDRTFAVHDEIDNVYHGEYAIQIDGHDRWGLIDKKGEWALKPSYYRIEPAPRNYWKVGILNEEDVLYLNALSPDLEKVLEEDVRQLDINEDAGIVYSLPNHLKMAIGFDGTKSENFLIRDILPLYYDDLPRTDEGDYTIQQATLYKYVMDDGYEGLCTAGGEIITEPKYWNLSARGKDLYIGEFKATDVGEMLNSKGEVVNL